jgi:hypothetical protein
MTIESDEIEDAVIEDIGEKTDTVIKGFEAMTQKLADFEIRLVNMANKLDDHMHEADAHHPAMLGRKQL